MALNLGETADRIYKKNAEIAAANEVVKQLEGEKKELENTLLSAMEQAGTDIVRGELATVSVSTTVRPQISDFEEFAKFVLKRKAPHLFERRVASGAYKEMKEMLGNKPIPGISEFNQVRLNVRKL
jgi:hypothetical protein